MFNPFEKSIKQITNDDLLTLKEKKMSFDCLRLLDQTVGLLGKLKLHLTISSINMRCSTIFGYVKNIIHVSF